MEFLNGAYAEYINVPKSIVKRNLLHLPDSLSYEKAAFAEPLANVVHGVEKTGIKPGQTVGVVGIGPIGLMFVKLAKLKGEIDIPYFANGDIISPETAKKCLEISKADGIAIGRAAMGDLSLIYRIEKYLNDGILIPEPDLKERIKMLKKHLDFQISFRGEETGIKFFRKFYPAYIRNIRKGAEYRHSLITELNYNKILNILDEILLNA